MADMEKRRFFRQFLLISQITAVMIFIPSCEIPDPSSPPYTLYEIDPGWGMETDGDGHLWVNNKDGVAEYDPAADEWTQYSRGDDYLFASNGPGPLLVDGSSLWIGYGEENDPEGLGVTKWDRTAESFTQYGSVHGTANMPGGGAMAIGKKDDGSIWVGTTLQYAASRFDGTSWTSFEIDEDDEGLLYRRCENIRFGGSYGYFYSDRGGLHVYDFSSGQWIHSERGAAAGTESFLCRGFSYRGLLPTDSGFYLATDDNLYDPVTYAPDGVWQYDGSNLTNISPEDYEAGEAVQSLVLDGAGRLWAHFSQDESVRYRESGVWKVWNPGGLYLPDDSCLEPLLFDGTNMWFEVIISREQDSSTSQILKYQL